MNILSFVEGANPTYGGIGIHSAPLIGRYLSERGHHLRMVIGGTVNPGQEKYVIKNHPQQSCFSFPGSQGSFGIFAYPAFTRWSFSPAMLGDLNDTARQADFFLLHSLYSFPVLAGHLLAIRHQKPYAVWMHGVLAPFQKTVGKNKKALYDFLFSRSILKHASALIFTARGEKSEIGQLDLRSPTTIIPLGFESAGRLSGRPGIFRKTFLQDFQGNVILFLGRVNAKKGLDILIPAFHKVLQQSPNTILVIVGGDDPPAYGDKIRNLVAGLGLSKNVLFTGLLVGQDKADVLADADLFVLPSRAENFGYSIFEAMAQGIPVLVSNEINYAAEIVHAGAGIALPLLPDLFTQQILRLIDEPFTRIQMGEKGRQFVSSFSWQKCAESLENLVSCILHNFPIPDEYPR